MQIVSYPAHIIVQEGQIKSFYGKIDEGSLPVSDAH